jgi:hypothetical protein
MEVAAIKNARERSHSTLQKPIARQMAQSVPRTRELNIIKGFVAAAPLLENVLRHSLNL